MFALICLLVSFSNSFDFDNWVSKFDKHFSAIESLRRRAIFVQNARFVDEFNKHNTFKLDVDGPFAAHTHEEYLKTLKRSHQDSEEEEDNSVSTQKESLKSFPETLDLRTLGKVTKIRDQNPCGGCYSFGALASLEGRLLFIKGDPKTLDLSEEQAIRCSENNGCNGGFGYKVYDYIKENGIVQEKDYPFTATDGECKVDLSKKFATVSGYTKVAKRNNDALKSALVDGVVDVAIDASSVKFQLYKTGVYHDTKCSSAINRLNHEISAVGYGNLNGEEYWIVRNSWGRSWGDKGYILMAIEGNTCGVTTDPVYPTGVKYI
ncbi:cysteine proteinase 2 precursor, putative [Entamoeba invadens IP1]|uniref:Cysteine proteinase 2, putative n=1 Tax=Entamoeba invadens IP1 TaxID=370355 RepID=L7FKK3_ENTIV|nr:cysteine proteinase 2 precursor, putative [Entamoeba invadens IP1]ELP86618.1 cysteine proteinase 2 precursor, putative [Entamoeba invadens IP1]|eukprot:XP_004185964.1 cysteine proteinase 2 precursor, putative [Entamoeba invadens IP1]